MLKYQALNEYRAIMYARKLRDLFAENAQLVCREIGDGNLNLVFHIRDKCFREKHHYEAGSYLCAGGGGILAINPRPCAN